MQEIVWLGWKFFTDQQCNLSRGAGILPSSAFPETAARVFNDPHAVYVKDRIVDGEQRSHAVGMTADTVLLVVHVYRMESKGGKEEIIRIISAREANKRERRNFVQQPAQ